MIDTELLNEMQDMAAESFKRRQNQAGQLPNADVQILEAIYYQNVAIIDLLTTIAQNQEGFSS